MDFFEMDCVYMYMLKEIYTSLDLNKFLENQINNNYKKNDSKLMSCF